MKEQQIPRGYTPKKIAAFIEERIAEWLETVPPNNAAEIKDTEIKDNFFVAGGAIASMLLGEKPKDIDIFFGDQKIVDKLSRHYDGNVQPFEDALDFEPVIITNSAIGLKGGIQIITGFVGPPQIIIDKFDFEHTQNFYCPNLDLTVTPDALLSLLSHQLKYTGQTEYPLSSFFRAVKFVKRGWNISAGELFKIAFDISKLDLENPEILEDQLTGVDVVYFFEFIEKLKSGDKEINRTYLFRLINEVFDL